MSRFLIAAVAVFFVTMPSRKKTRQSLRRNCPTRSHP